MIERPSLVAVALLAVAAHATALGGGYVWLDHAHLEQGLALAPPGEWWSLFGRGFAETGFYRPLVALSLSIDAALHRSPGFFGAVTLAWHALASMMTLLTARRLGLSAGAALVAGLLFAVHPVTSLVASSTAFRSESMLTVFLLGVIVAHRAGRPFLAALALLAAALTKETGWVLGPLFVAALEVSRYRRSHVVFETPVHRRLLGAEAVALVMATGLRLVFAPPFRAVQPSLTLDEHIGSRLSVIAKSALSLVLPYDGSVCDAFPVRGSLSFGAVGGALVLAVVAVVVLRRPRALTWLFALSLLPLFELVPVMRWWSPHYLYVPLAFGAMLVAREVDRRGPRLRQGLVVAGAALLVLSVLGGRRFTSDERLWGPEVAREPACREGHFYLGEVAREAGDFEAAARHYEKAAHGLPDVLAYVDEQAALENLGAMRFAQGRPCEARAAWEAALGRSTDTRDRRELAHNLATVALTTGNPAEAVRLLEPEVARDDALPEALLVRAKALHALGREPEAVALVKRVRTARR